MSPAQSLSCDGCQNYRNSTCRFPIAWASPLPLTRPVLVHLLAFASSLQAIALALALDDDDDAMHGRMVLLVIVIGQGQGQGHGLGLVGIGRGGGDGPEEGWGSWVYHGTKG